MTDIVYNDLGYSAWWFSRNLLNAAGYMGFQYGAVIAASSGMSPPRYLSDVR